MTDTIAGIRELIVAKLDAVEVGGNPAIAEVFPQAEGDFTKYPSATVTIEGWDGEEVDTHRNQRTFHFEVKLYQEQGHAGKTKEAAAAAMEAAVDAIIVAFDRDKTLGGELQVVRVVSGETSFRVAAGTFDFATFRIDCVAIVPNYE